MKTLIFAAFSILLLATTASVPAQQKLTPVIAVAATGNTVAAQVSPQPGPSPFFLFFDKQGAFIEAVNNPAKDSGSPGPAVLDFLAGKGIKTVVAGWFGPQIVEVAKSKGMRAVVFTGSAKDAAKKALELK